MPKYWSSECACGGRAPQLLRLTCQPLTPRARARARLPATASIRHVRRGGAQPLHSCVSSERFLLTHPAPRANVRAPQIVSTFLKSLDIPWPSSFRSAMARVSVLNVNLVTLPKAVRPRRRGRIYWRHCAPSILIPLAPAAWQACMNPSLGFYAQFNGYARPSWQRRLHFPCPPQMTHRPLA